MSFLQRDRMGCDCLPAAGCASVDDARAGLRARMGRSLPEGLRHRRFARPSGDRSLPRDAIAPRAWRSRPVPRLLEGVCARVPLDINHHCGRRIRHL